ncbi:RsmB/NOP family class I SAM-dependent RNA methyltransferase [Albirhodobacter sp. R86504]|uniref:RsmB/NOP family class I SAM-dependent RNA methyltransferase n=1 Tax=Albirhodobacter sp. R86504 TaxID=3093848 RepID=UPI00366CD0FF
MAIADPARMAALALLAGAYEAGVTVSDQIAAGALDHLAPGDRGRAQRLALSTLRNGGRADKVLKAFVRRRPPVDIQILLYLATVEMLEEGVAPHGVVSTAVSLARQGGPSTESYAGLINAVLRKVADVTPEAWAKIPAPELPSWLRGQLMSAYGKSNTQKMEAVQVKGAPLDITAKGDPAALVEALGATLLPTGTLRLPARAQVSELPGFAEGQWWVQDAAAALAAKALNPQAGERVLDLCAAPGGKTMQLAAAGAQVTALDLSRPRLKRLHENLERTGLTAEVIAEDALHYAPSKLFDAVLLDAPCSATGTIRRHPDLPFVRDPATLKDLFTLQAGMLDHALTMLKPQGRLVFCTCSLLPEEGEGQIKAALERHAGLRTLPITLQGIDPDWITSEGGLRLRPDYWADLGGMDGFYIAVLTRAD